MLMYVNEWYVLMNVDECYLLMNFIEWYVLMNLDECYLLMNVNECYVIMNECYVSLMDEIMLDINGEFRVILGRGGAKWASTFALLALLSREY